MLNTKEFIKGMTGLFGNNLNMIVFDENGPHKITTKKKKGESDGRKQNSTAKN